MNDRLEALEAAQQHLDDGAPSDAFPLLSPWVSWPSSFESGLEWDRSWSLFARIVAAMAQTELADAAAAVAADPRDPVALATFGFELIEVGLAPIAAGGWPTASRNNGLRPPTWGCSPVQSNRFL